MRAAVKVARTAPRYGRRVFDCSAGMGQRIDHRGSCASRFDPASHRPFEQSRKRVFRGRGSSPLYDFPPILEDERLRKVEMGLSGIEDGDGDNVMAEYKNASTLEPRETPISPHTT